MHGLTRAPRSRRGIAAVIAATVLVGSSLAPAAAPAAVEWGPCPAPPGGEPPPGQECASIPVPRDHGAPAGPAIEVAISRLRTATPARRRGVMLLNPGGPGGSGLDLPWVLSRFLPADVLERFDLIGFDPRGVGLSTPVSCSLRPELLQATRIIPWPGPEGIAENVAYAREVAESCGRSAYDALPFTSTANTARDMDRIRAELGEEKISYLGYSYGTYLGAVYASLYPGRADRFILDSVVHPERIWRETFRAWGRAVEIRFPDFTRWAAAQSGTYALGGTSAEVRQLYFDLADRLDREPMTFPDGMTLDGKLLREVTRQALYSDVLFPQLAEVWRLAKAGGAVERDELATRLGALLADVPSDNFPASLYAVTCNDASWPESVDRYARDVQTDGARYPVAGAMAANIWPCAFWQSEPREAPVPITRVGPRNVLLIQGLHDPATPYDGGRAMRLALGRRARLMTVDVGGHAIAFGLNGNTSACADHAATSFLITGRLPRDRFCRREPARPQSLGLEAPFQRAIEDLRRRMRVPGLWPGLPPVTAARSPSAWRWPSSTG